MPLSKLPSFRLHFVSAFLVTLLCFVVTYFLWGFYYVEYEGLNTSFFSGKLTTGLPFRSLYFSGNMGVSYLYSFLYQVLPNIEWLSWIYYSYLFFSCLIGLYLISVLLPDQVNIPLRYILLIATYFVVFADQNINFIYTRVAYMVCGLSLLGLIFFFNSPSTITSRIRLFVLLNFFFTIGVLTRYEAALACLLLMIFVGVFYIKQLKQFVCIFIYPSLVISALTIALITDIKTSNQFYKQVEPDIEEQLSERRNRVPLSYMKTHRDSVLYITATNIIWSDPKVISVKFLRSIIMSEKPLYTDVRQWNRVYADMLEIILKYWYLVALDILLCLALFLQTDFQGSMVRRFSWLAYECSFWILIAIQTYTDKVNDRSFVPFLSLFILSHILVIVASLSRRVSVGLYPLFILGIFAVAQQFYHLEEESKELKRELAKYKKNYEMIEKVASGHFLVLNSSSFNYILLNNVPFYPFDYSTFKGIYISEGYIIPFLPYYRRYLERECQCDIYSYPSFWNYLRSIKNEVIIVSNPITMDVINNYLKDVYHAPLLLKENSSQILVDVSKTDSGYPEDQLKIYNLLK